MAILSPALSSHPATVFHIHDIIQHPANVVGTDRRRNIRERLVANIAELSDTGRTLVVHVPPDKSLPVYPYYISMAA